MFFVFFFGGAYYDHCCCCCYYHWRRECTWEPRDYKPPLAIVLSPHSLYFLAFLVFVLLFFSSSFLVLFALPGKGRAHCLTCLVRHNHLIEYVVIDFFRSTLRIDNITHYAKTNCDRVLFFVQIRNFFSKKVERSILKSDCGGGLFSEHLEIDSH